MLHILQAHNPSAKPSFSKYFTFRYSVSVVGYYTLGRKVMGTDTFKLFYLASIRTIKFMKSQDGASNQRQEE